MVMLLGLTGYSGSGKDEVGKILLANEVYTKRLAFADKLKGYVAEMLRLPGIEDVDRVKDMTWADAGLVRPRLVEDVLGTVRDAIIHVGHAYGAPHWCALLKEDLEPLLKNGEKVVVTDVRFPEEELFLREEYSATIVKVVRPGVKPKGAGDAKVDEIYADFTIINDGTLGDLETKVADMIYSPRFNRCGRIQVTFRSGLKDQYEWSPVLEEYVALDHILEPFIDSDGCYELLDWADVSSWVEL